jgi:Uma2 family endonuclease
MPPPKEGHHRIQRRIRKLLEVLAGGKGAVDSEFAFRPAGEYEVWVADVAFVTSERDARTGDDEYLAGAPDLVVEVLSPGNTAYEINDKMSVCLDNGCLSFWVVDPKNKRVSVTEGAVTRHYGVTASFTCDVPGATISVGGIFE